MSISGRFYFDPLRETAAGPRCVSVLLSSLAPPVEMVTCDPKTVQKVEMAIRTRTFNTQREGLRMIQDESGGLVPLNRPEGVAGGVGGGCTHDCLELSFEGASLHLAQVVPRPNGLAQLDQGHNDAVLGLLEEIARARGVTLRRD